MARSTIGADAGLRAYLLEEAKSFVTLMVSTMLNDSKESGKHTFDLLSPRVTAIEAGEAVHLRRYELPPEHRFAAPGGGHPCDMLVLDEHDVLSVALPAASD